MKKPVVLILCAMLLAAAPTFAQDKIKLKVMGQPLAGGMIQKHKEQPFFQALAAKSGLPIEVDCKPQDTTGIKDTEALRVLARGQQERRVRQHGADAVGHAADLAAKRLVRGAGRVCDLCRDPCRSCEPPVFHRPARGAAGGVSSEEREGGTQGRLEDLAQRTEAADATK